MDGKQFMERQTNKLPNQQIPLSSTSQDRVLTDCSEGLL